MGDRSHAVLNIPQSNNIVCNNDSNISKIIVMYKVIQCIK